MASVLSRLKVALNKSPDGLTLDELATAARTTPERVRGQLPELREALARELNVVIPQPAARNGYRYQAAHADEVPLHVGDQARLEVDLTRARSRERDARAAAKGHVEAGNLTAALWWQEYADRAEYDAKAIGHRLAATKVHIPAGGTPAPSRNGARRGARLVP